MLIYLASYPRSGNYWVRNLLFHYFGRRSASIYRDDYFGDHNLIVSEDGSFESLFYEYAHPHDQDQKLHCLMSDCGKVLTKAVRQQLAAEDEAFFVKTHELPFADYFEGERAIHIVRHPGAVMWSYFNYLLDEGASPELTLEHVIESRVFGGSWATHTERWCGLAGELGGGYLRLRYEALFEGHADFVEKVQRLTGIDAAENPAPFPDFEYWRSRDPTKFRSGEIGEWESQFSGAQVSLVWALHGETMKVLGYPLPDLRQDADESMAVERPQPFEAGTAVSQTELLIEGLRANLLRIAKEVQDQEDELLERIKSKDQAIAKLRETLEKTRHSSMEARQKLEGMQRNAVEKQESIDSLRDQLAQKQKSINHLREKLRNEKAHIERIEEQALVRALRRLRLLKW